MQDSENPDIFSDDPEDDPVVADAELPVAAE